ncbi:MAG: crotonase/enoyl-CoA hydratase family protein [Pseudomonadota bacterium]
MFETLTLDVDPRGVATLTLNRPDKHNAMSALMIDELSRAAERLRSDEDIRVVVLTGTGRSFCAGGDLGWMRAQIEADSETRATEARRLATMLGALNSLPKPLIGRIQGQAFGGGVGLMCVCDIAIGVEEAKFGLTETRLGLIPATIGPYVAARLGPAARRVFFSSRLFATDEAVALGLLSKSVAPKDLDEAVEAEVVPCLSSAPGAIAEAKALIGDLVGRVDAAAVDASVNALVRRWQSPEAAEGVASFFEKRRPGWSRSD